MTQPRDGSRGMCISIDLFSVACLCAGPLRTYVLVGCQRNWNGSSMDDDSIVDYACANMSNRISNENRAGSNRKDNFPSLAPPKRFASLLKYGGKVFPFLPSFFFKAMNKRWWVLDIKSFRSGSGPSVLKAHKLPSTSYMWTGRMPPEP